jgi:hypothetical protein
MFARAVSGVQDPPYLPNCPLSCLPYTFVNLALEFMKNVVLPLGRPFNYIIQLVLPIITILLSLIARKMLETKRFIIYNALNNYCSQQIKLLKSLNNPSSSESGIIFTIIKQVQDCVALVQELRAIDRDVVGVNRIFDYENFTYLNAFINDDGNDLICAADV